MEIWKEVTDPAKYVYEELGIATFLICMFELEREKSGSDKWVWIVF